MATSNATPETLTVPNATPERPPVPNATRATGAERKAAKDRNRPRHGKCHRKRLHVLNNPNHQAFKGWEDEDGPWTLRMCDEYVEWCHISKLFPTSRHNKHRHTNKANLKFCENPEFIQRCIEVWQVLYQRAVVERNEIALSIARGVYAEVVLKKEVDWTTMKSTTHMTKPKQNIPKGVLLFPLGGLGPVRSAYEKQQGNESDTQTSEADDDSDGTREPKTTRPREPVTVANQVPRARTEARRPPRGRSTRVPSIVPPSTTVTVGASTSSAIPVPIPTVPDVSRVFDFDDGEAMEVQTSANTTPLQEERPADDDAMTLAKALDLLKVKDARIASLEANLSKLQLECQQKSHAIADQLVELQRLRDTAGTDLIVPDADDAFIQRDANHLDKVVEDLTDDIDERSPLRKRARPFICAPSANPLNSTRDTGKDPIDVHGTQDSLSFPPLPQLVQSSVQSPTHEKLQKENEVLRSRLDEIQSTHYHWKLACILSVDRCQQVAKELEKVSKNFVAKNPKRENGLTSWALLEDLFPNDMPMSENNAQGNVIDWVRNGWDYQNGLSCHEHEEEQKLLWPKPASFVLDHTICPICQEEFGPEGGWALGSCVHVYHPQCLISQCLIRRRCVICSAPFHERLYVMFNLLTYMPPSWEHNDATTDQRALWGRDLVWSWRQGLHDQDQGQITSHLNWETNPDQIVEVAHKMMGAGTRNEGKRAFFYQCLGGFYNPNTNTFEWGPHPQGHRWNFQGERAPDRNENSSLEDMDDAQHLDSTYCPYYTSQALDYIMEAHSPQTMRTLEALKDSNILAAILQADGPASRTRARRKLVVGQSSNYERGEGSGSRDDPSVLG